MYYVCFVKPHLPLWKRCNRESTQNSFTHPTLGKVEKRFVIHLYVVIHKRISYHKNISGYIPDRITDRL